MATPVPRKRSESDTTAVHSCRRPRLLPPRLPPHRLRRHPRLRLLVLSSHPALVSAQVLPKVQMAWVRPGLSVHRRMGVRGRHGHRYLRSGRTSSLSSTYHERRSTSGRSAGHAKQCSRSGQRPRAGRLPLHLRLLPHRCPRRQAVRRCTNNNGTRTQRTARQVARRRSARRTVRRASCPAFRTSQSGLRARRCGVTARSVQRRVVPGAVSSETPSLHPNIPRRT